MTEKEMRRLRRVELLEMLWEQSKEIDRLTDQLEQLQQELEDRRIALERAGSIAEASLNVNKVFEAVQAAADQYLANVEQKSREAEQLLESARQQAEQILSDARQQTRQSEQEAQ